MAKANSRRRNSAFDLTKAEYVKPQTRLEANRWLDKAQFGAATAYTDISASTKLNIVPEAGSVDDAVRLMDIGYSAWVDEQLADDTDVKVNIGRELGIAYGDTVFCTTGNNSGGLSTGHVLYGNWFNALAVHGKSKLRLKATFALSQIFALRQVGTTFETLATADFVHSLWKATRSTNSPSYRKLLEEVTYNVVMGKWLTYQGNQKEDVALNRQPDENYAREILQLFSMGLVCMNMDGTPVLDAQGNPIPTYTAEDIPECAKFFTGLVVSSPNVNQTPYMEFWSWLHEPASKKLFAYPGGSPVVLPARTSTGNSYNQGNFNNKKKSPDSGYVITVIDANTFTVQTEAPITNPLGTEVRDTYTNRAVAYYLDNTYATPITATATRGESETITITKTAHGLTNGQTIYHKSTVEIDIDAMLDHIFNHPTTPVYISKSLIKFFVTSNPTPQYIRRVSEKFVNNGNGVRGDLSAVIKAILTDREAIIPFGINPNNHGRLLNPLERIYKVANALRSDLVSVYADSNLSVNTLYKTMGALQNKPINRQYFDDAGPTWVSGQMQFMNTPSVFNFYRPGYTPPSTTLGNLGLTAPESQIINTEAQIVWFNMIDAMCDYASQQPELSSSTDHPNRLLYNAEGALDPRGGHGRFSGVQFDASSWTVTSKTDTTVTVTGTITVPFSGSVFLGQVWINRRNDFRIGNPSGNGATFNTWSAGAGAKTITLTGLNLTQTSNIEVGDILDSPPCWYTGHFGFPTTYVITGGNQAGNRLKSPYVPLLYKAALTLPDSASNPTQAEMDVAINYLESILMSRPISTELRAIMSSAATQPVTLPSNFVPATDPITVNHYRNFRWSYNQIRIRRMLAMLLLSPEFLVQY